MAKKKSKRRPPPPIVEIFKTSLCPNCQSSERSQYQNVRRFDVGYGVLIYRRCKCLKCGLWRDDAETI